MLIGQIALVILAIQNSELILLMKYSTTLSGPKYLASTAVLLSEIFKFIICIFLVLWQKYSSNKSISIEKMITRLFGNNSNILQLAIPGYFNLIKI